MYGWLICQETHLRLIQPTHQDLLEFNQATSRHTGSYCLRTKNRDAHLVQLFGQ